MLGNTHRMAEHCEAAQPSIMKSSPEKVMICEYSQCVTGVGANDAYTQGNDLSFSFVENGKQLDRFLKLQSPSNSEFGIDSDENSDDDANTLGDSLSSSSVENDKQLNRFVKLQSPSHSELGPDSDENLNSDDDSSNSVHLIPEEEKVDVAEEQGTHIVESQDEIPMTVSMEVHQEVGQPCASTGKSEMVTGCDLSFMFFRLNLTTRPRSPGKRFQFSATYCPCLGRELRNLMAQQVIITDGWKENISTSKKRSLRHLEYTQDLVNGHPIGKCILNAFRKDSVYYRGDFIGERKGSLIVNSSQSTTPHRQLFSQLIDESISQWEETFSKQFRKEKVYYKGCDITAPLLLVLLYRSAYQGSIMISHFIHSECRDCRQCSPDILETMVKLYKNHDDTCKAARQMKSSRVDETSAKDIISMVKEKCIQKELHLLYCHSEELAHRYPYIEFPHFVEVGIHYRRKKYYRKTLHMVYMQIPPYFFAVPADCSSDTTYREPEPHFMNVVQEINQELVRERDSFFDQRPDLRDKENLVMIYPYRFDPDGRHSECRFLRVNIKVDEG